MCSRYPYRWTRRHYDMVMRATLYRGFRAKLEAPPAIVTVSQAFDLTAMWEWWKFGWFKIDSSIQTIVICLIWLQLVSLVVSVCAPLLVLKGGFSLSLSSLSLSLSRSLHPRARMSVRACEKLKRRETGTTQVVKQYWTLPIPHRLKMWLLGTRVVPLGDLFPLRCGSSNGSSRLSVRRFTTLSTIL